MGDDSLFHCFDSIPRGKASLDIGTSKDQEKRRRKRRGEGDGSAEERLPVPALDANTYIVVLCVCFL